MYETYDRGIASTGSHTLWPASGPTPTPPRMRSTATWGSDRWILPPPPPHPQSPPSLFTVLTHTPQNPGGAALRNARPNVTLLQVDCITVIKYFCRRAACQDCRHAKRCWHLRFYCSRVCDKRLIKLHGVLLNRAAPLMAACARPRGWMLVWEVITLRPHETGNWALSLSLSLSLPAFNSWKKGCGEGGGLRREREREGRESERDCNSVNYSYWICFSQPRKSLPARNTHHHFASKSLRIEINSNSVS